MVPVTTVLSLLGAAALWVRWRWHDRPDRSWWIAALVMTASAAIVACHAAGNAPAPFQFAHGAQVSPTTLSSPVTATMFFTLGLALLLSGGTRHAMVAQGIALAVLLLALLNLSGYLFRDTFLYRFLPGRGTSILTSAQAILLALGTLFLHPRGGLLAAVTGELPAARISRRLLIWAFVAPVLTGAATELAARYGLYDSGTALPLFIWTLAVLLLVTSWRFALKLLDVDVARSQAERELQGALRELRAEHDRKDIFLATLAHELRNPLAPIGAAAEILRHGGGQTPTERERIGAIVAAQTANLVNLVNDLLDMERVSSGRIALDKNVMDLREPLADALEQVRPLLARKRHDCRVDAMASPIHVCGDRMRLVQILSNLFNNAAKYTPPGGTIHVRVVLSAKAVAVTVEDNGIGIAADVLPRVFEPYAQAALTPDRAEGGLGLGLPLVKRLTELHGGSVTAHSAGAGRGSRFSVTLPLMMAAAPRAG
ncbi:sensor histidine kinase [Pseudoduganella chitinolytica]|uniref:histidine kinase n=1 Tax=Pseudoduganella chitinolytica TaxID=34070 RepID=A0ABY8BA87_9BURK|nr:HAMP domain-containing sensor histidine kinase [Pseudoduganella chitinolytica]WEF32832.1 HAMP domain-containing sensor histidine kinase [Pseudoduganella chitinolytica]